MRALLLFPLTFLALACQPPCDPVSTAPASVCHRSTDGGTIIANTPFTLEGQVYFSGGSCSVTVEDGGRVNLVVSGNSCGTANGASAIRVFLPNPVPCDVPALPEGAYVINSQVPVMFSIPASDGGVPACL